MFPSHDLEQHITNLAQDVKHDEKKEGLSRMSSPLNDFQGGLHAKNEKHSESGEHLGPKRSSSYDDSAVMRHAAGIEAARQRDEARIEQQRADLMNYNPVVDRSGLDRASCGHTGKKRK